jgi:tetratricopeptide (TPR) repeat protein
MDAAREPGFATASHSVMRWDQSFEARIRLLAASPDSSDARAWLELGILARSGGDPAASLRCLRRATSLSPAEPACYHQLGLSYRASGRTAEAIAEFRRALTLAPESDDVANDCGVTLAELGEIDEASRTFESVVRRSPGDLRAWNNLGNVLRRLDRLEDALACLQKVVELRSDLAEAHGNLGLVLTAMGRHEEALACHDRSLQLRPGAASSHVNRGVALTAMGLDGDAEAAFTRAFELDPSCAEALIQLGLLRGRLGDRAESLRYHQAAAVLRPDGPEACNNLGNALRAVGRVEEAAACYERAVHLEPDFAEAQNNLAMTRLQRGQVAEALAGFDRAVGLHPGLAEARINRAYAWLSLGDLARGWHELEWRRRLPDPPIGHLPGLEWDGTELDDRVVVVHAEQGQGDTLQFARFAGTARARGARVWLRVPRPLMSPLSRCPGVERVLPLDSVSPEAPLHIAMMSLPGRLGIDRTHHLGWPVPYLFADKRLCQTLEAKMGPAGGLRVGIFWQGNPRFPEDWHRSIPLTKFLPLTLVEGVQFFVLQRGPGLDQLPGLADRWQPRLLSAPNGDEWCWEHTAAVIRQLDLVITSDSAVAHLAGAMGRPVWVALSAAADWRWLRDREDSPWYPTMRLFRQTTWRVWDDVFERIAQALECRLAGWQAGILGVP